MEVQVLIDKSRLKSRIGEFANALDILSQAQPSIDFSDAKLRLHIEMNRIFLLRGNHTTLEISYRSIRQENDQSTDIISIQNALNYARTTLDLDGSLKYASSLFRKYLPKLESDEMGEQVPLILYYCLEVYYLWREYGDGLDDPGIVYDGSFLQKLILRLAKPGFYFEVLTLVEYFVENPQPPLEKLASSLLADGNLAFIHCMFCLAKIFAQNGCLEDAEGIIEAVESSLKEELRTIDLHCQMIRLRYFTGGSTKAQRISELIRLSKKFLEIQDYILASQALEYAAELAESLSDIVQATNFGHEIHSHLRTVWNTSGDKLTLTLIEFRYCDFLNASTSNYAMARDRRNEFLSLPLANKLPYFQRFHKRQWAEYFMIHQRDNALYHAEKYLKYCKNCRSEEEQSLAENIKLQTILHPHRTSEEKRIDVLEDICSKLRKGIENDTTKSFFGSLAEKQLLLVEAIMELGRLQQEDPEDLATEAREILQEAEALLNKADGRVENAYIKYEIAFLKASASAFLEGHLPQQSAVGRPFEEDEDIFGGSFSGISWLQLSLISLRNENLQNFEHMLHRLEDFIRPDARKETTIRHAEATFTKAMIYYYLIELDMPRIERFRLVANIPSLTQGAGLVLEYLEQAFDLKDQLEKETRDKKNESTEEALAASQAYFTADLEQLYFDIALELAFGLQDKNLTWKWIQKRKARGLTSMLRTLGSSGKPQPNADDWVRKSPITFEDLQFVQTASATKLVFVDWVIFGVSPAKLLLFSFCMGRDDDGPIAIREMIEIEASLEELKEEAEKIDERRMNYDDADRFLRPFVPVIAPLELCCQEGDILILSPTAPLHNLPLHAIILANKPLIERNPILYVPSHAVLVNCLLRLAAPSPGADASKEWKASIFGAYDDGSSVPETVSERSKIYESLTTLATNFQCSPLLGKDLTKDAVKQDSVSSKVIHFHGHGMVDPHIPSHQSLILGSPSEILTIPAITSLNLNAAHVTLIACSGGVQDFSLSGDEPLGLLSSFLIGGATSVIGALWPIQSSTGRLFMRIFYEYFLHYVDRTELGPIVNLARALQHTILKIRKSEGTGRPYHWAPFVLYGVWFCGRKPGTW